MPIDEKVKLNYIIELGVRKFFDTAPCVVVSRAVSAGRVMFVELAT